MDVEGFVRAWTALRSKTKQLQYADVHKLSTLDQLKRSLENLTANQTDSSDVSEQVRQLTLEVTRLEVWSEHRMRIWSRERYLQKGDTKSAFFLRRFKTMRSRNTLRTLVSDQGVRLSTEPEIVWEVHSYFSRVFSQPAVVMDSHTLDDFLSVQSGKLSPQQSAFMDDVPSYREFSDILLSSPNGRAPGWDGFNTDAISKIWSFIGQDYSAVMIHCWKNGSFPTGFLDGVIAFVSKQPGAEVLKDLRPITLLTSVYKIFAKVIASRLALILPTLVPAQQQWFTSRRYVHQNVLAFSFVHEALKRERRLASFLMVDFAKAFDSLRHDYILRSLQTLGFSAFFVTLISSLLQGAGSLGFCG
ncbi:hypothetical protein R1sor_006290 [Riccia sorocarpa]|uniref:Reverse transcriptase domain-containing protein n=1 Tax=Riccia sorocarpa TaxID=122646 RepID=A0ABD3HQL8_9MARC